MPRIWDVDVTLSLQGRLRRSARDWQVEITVFIGNLEEFGVSATDLSNYTTVTGGHVGSNGDPDQINFELKTRGSWTPLVLRVYGSGLLILSDL